MPVNQVLWSHSKIPIPWVLVNIVVHIQTRYQKDWIKTEGAYSIWKEVDRCRTHGMASNKLCWLCQLKVGCYIVYQIVTSLNVFQVLHYHNEGEANDYSDTTTRKLKYHILTCWHHQMTYLHHYLPFVRGIPSQKQGMWSFDNFLNCWLEKAVKQTVANANHLRCLNAHVT